MKWARDKVMLQGSADIPSWQLSVDHNMVNIVCVGIELKVWHFTSAYMNGSTYVRTILSEPKFLRMHRWPNFIAHGALGNI